jgi:hypothetical protein
MKSEGGGAQRATSVFTGRSGARDIASAMALSRISTPRARNNQESMASEF